MNKRCLLAMCLTMVGMGPAKAQELTTNMYGYVNGYFEKVEEQPSGAGTYSKNPLEYDVPDIHFVMLSRYGSAYKAFLNMKAPGAEAVEVSNAWVEMSMAKDDLLNFRLGKTYRPFGLYNEILDAVPTYIGIEPPEMLDKDHLFVTRTTNMMLHGRAEMGPGYLSYALTTGNDEKTGTAIPVGADVHYEIGTKWKVGVSYYTTGGDAAPTKAPGEGSPSGGVLPWMAKDEFQVMGFYAQYMDDDWIIQSEIFQADHDITRDTGILGGSSYCGVGGTYLNTRQFARLCGGTAGDPTNYKVDTWYIRIGRTFGLKKGTITPYLQYDTYSNPETIMEKDLGGDNEAGASDDGEFVKYTAGVVYRPVTPVALKFDYSRHEQDFEGEDASYGEVRFSFSYYWRL